MSQALYFNVKTLTFQNLDTVHKFGGKQNWSTHKKEKKKNNSYEQLHCYTCIMMLEKPKISELGRVRGKRNIPKNVTVSLSAQSFLGRRRKKRCKKGVKSLYPFFSKTDCPLSQPHSPFLCHLSFGIKMT